MITLNKNLILASQSPRRQELLKGLGFTFSVKSLQVDESFPEDMKPELVARFLAEKKANAYRNELGKDELLITADTVVITQNKILNKPSNSLEAANMLRQLSGTKHQVITGVCIMDMGKKFVFDDTTLVFLNQLEEQEISYYINQFQPYDKAGAYGIQEWLGHAAIQKIEGSFYNVMGLPVHKVYQTLKNNFEIGF